MNQQSNFWQNLPRPFWALAPMEDVTDTVFRQIVASVGRPHVFFTEFTNIEAMAHGASRGRLEFTPGEHPVVGQLWGNRPEAFATAAQTVRELGFDGIDLNFGCPVKDVMKHGCCAALIGQESLVSEIIAATKEGAQDLPVSVKTRIGNKKIITEDWIGFLLRQDLAAITIHGRTAAEMSVVPAHWDEIAKAVNIRNSDSNCNCKIIGNGDVKNLLDAKHYVLEAGVDGVMIGRGIFENPALFAEKELTRAEKLELFKKHIELFDQTWGKTKNFQILKKFVKTYINGFEGAAEMRVKLMESRDIRELGYAILE